MLFEFSINIGNVLTLLSFIVGGIVFVAMVRTNVMLLISRVDLLEKQIQKLSEILVALARQDERMNAIERRMDELRRGRGFIVEDFGSKGE